MIVATLATVNAKLGSKEFMLCGGLSTAVTDLLLFPLDTIKVTQQSSKAFMSGTQAFKQILKNGGGFSSLYKGALGYAAMDGIGAAVFFAAYERAKRFTTETMHLSGPWLGASIYGSAAAAFGVSSILLGNIHLLTTCISNVRRFVPDFHFRNSHIIEGSNCCCQKPFSASTVSATAKCLTMICNNIVR